MKKKIILKILIGIAGLLLLVKFFTSILVEPWVGKKIAAALNGEPGNYIVEIGKVHIAIFKSAIEFESISIYPKPASVNLQDLNGEIESVRFKGIRLFKAIFRHDIYINAVNISNSTFNGKIPFLKDALPPIVIPENLRIKSLIFNKINAEIGNTLDAQSFSVKDGFLKIYDLQVEKLDTLFSGIIEQFDFKAEELFLVRADSMYSYKTSGIIYSEALQTLEADSFIIQPTYVDYDFTSRYKYQMSIFEARFSNIYVHDFPASDFLRNRNFVSSYIEIGKMDMEVFRDKRKEFRHMIRPAFQDMIYSYPGILEIDSIVLLDGNVNFTVHAEEANEAGSISFNEINSRLYSLTNNTIYRKGIAYMELKAHALLMGKGKLAILLRGRLFDKNNTFLLEGTLSSLEANELNPILEKSAFFYATSGTIDAMNFSFTADNSKAAGKMTLLYHGLDIAVKNKRTDDTTAFKERFMSFIANRRFLDSNPTKDEDVREGIIDFDRDPERYLFHYCFRSILSGITSSIAKNPKK